MVKVDSMNTHNYMVQLFFLFFFNRLVDNMRVIMKHNFIQSIVAVSSVLLAVHYCHLTDNCPITVVEGPSQTGKTTTLAIALSLVGMCE